MRAALNKVQGEALKLSRQNEVLKKALTKAGVRTVFLLYNDILDISLLKTLSSLRTRAALKEAQEQALETGQRK